MQKVLSLTGGRAEFSAQGTSEEVVKITEGNFLHLLLCHAHPRKAGKQIGNLRAVLQPSRAGIVSRICGAVMEKFTKVKAAADVIDSHHIDHMGCVASQRLRLLPVCIHKPAVGVQTHNPAGIPNGPQLCVRQISGHIAQGFRIGMGGNHRAGSRVHHIPERLFI